MSKFRGPCHGAFQQRLRADTWSWERRQIEEALADLESHQFVERDEHSGSVSVTPLGCLGGAGVEVESVVRLVDALRDAGPESITEPTLIAAAQVTTELDGVLFPINRKSTKKEPETWMNELRRQGVAHEVMRALHRRVEEEVQATLRAKKAAACLLWITDWSMARIEQVMTQFGGGLDGAAGPIRSVAARTCDLLPTVVRVAELLHPGLDLGDTGVRLLTRLTAGVPGEIVDLAAEIGSGFDRADYQALSRGGLASIEAIEASADEQLRSCLGQDTKIAEVRRAVRAYREKQLAGEAVLPPILPTFER